MNRILAGLALLALPGFTAAQPPRKPDPAKFGWLTDYSQARAEARKTGRPIMLVFRCEP